MGSTSFKKEKSQHRMENISTVVIQAKCDLKLLLKELTTNETMIALLPNLHKLAAICLTLLVSTASVDRSFSHLKQIMTRL